MPARSALNQTGPFRRADPPPVLMRLAGVALTLLTLIVGAVWVLPGWLDWNHYKGAIARYASAQLQLPVRIDGPISVDLLPTPLVTAQDLTIGGGPAGVAVTARELQLRLAPGKLLSLHIVPRALTLRGADIHLPWPLHPADVAAAPAGWLPGAIARIENARLEIGGLVLSHLDARIEAGGAEANDLTIAGNASALGNFWAFSSRLGAPGPSGAAPLTAHVNAAATPNAPAPAISGQFNGVWRADGELRGRLAARADDLSALLDAPRIAATVNGTAALGGLGGASADLAVALGAAHLSVALHPGASPALSITSGTLDLDGWRQVFARRHATRPGLLALAGVLGTHSADLAIDALRSGGAMIRNLQARVDLDGTRLMIRHADALLPGGAAATLQGTLSPGASPRFAGAWTLDAPQFRQTLAWLVASGVRLAADLPPQTLRAAALHGTVNAADGRVDFDAIGGTLEQSRLGGHVGVDLASGAVDAALTLDRLDLDNWIPQAADPSWPAFSRGIADLSLALKLRAQTVSFRGETGTGLVLDAATGAGGITLNLMDIDAEGLHAHLAGAIDRDGDISQAALDLGAGQGTALADHLPSWARFTDQLWSGPVQLHMEATGPRDHLLVSLRLDLADARLEAHPVIDLTKAIWSTQMTLRHPGAQRLLGVLGWTGASDWLGEGSLSLLAQLSGEPGTVRADNFDLTAGTLHATGALGWTHGAGAPALLSGHVAADTLPLPQIKLRDTAPLPLGWLAANAQIDLTANRVVAGGTDLAQQLQARIAANGGIVRLDLDKASAGGGALTGAAALDTAATPPHLALQANLAGVTLAGPLFGTAIDLASGRIDATLDLAVQGYSPASLLASLGGQIHLAARNGALTGTDPAPPAPAAPSGTPFSALDAAVALNDGVATIGSLTINGPGGVTSIGGTADLPDGTIDLRLTLADQQIFRLSGPANSPRRISVALPAAPPASP